MLIYLIRIYILCFFVGRWSHWSNGPIRLNFSSCRPAVPLLAGWSPLTCSLPPTAHLVLDPERKWGDGEVLMLILILSGGWQLWWVEATPWWVYFCVFGMSVCVQRGSSGREGRADQTAVWSNVEHVCGSSPRPLALVTISLGIIRPAGPRSLYLAFSPLRSEVADPFLSSALPSSYGAFCRNTSSRICAPSSVTIQSEGDPSRSCRILTKIWIMTSFLCRLSQ